MKTRVVKRFDQKAAKSLYHVQVWQHGYVIREIQYQAYWADWLFGPYELQKDAETTAERLALGVLDTQIVVAEFGE